MLRGTNVNGPVPGMGRITGSSSIETLVRVGIEKENGLSPDSKMVVLHDFTPCVDDELTVKRGQVSMSFYLQLNNEVSEKCLMPNNTTCLFLILNGFTILHSTIKTYK